MALVSGFLKQRCLWTPRPTGEADVDAYGQPIAPAPVEIRCRWVTKRGWGTGVMGDGPTSTSNLSEVLVDKPVNPGDTLSYTDKDRTVSGTVKFVTHIMGVNGKEEGRTCYV